MDFELLNFWISKLHFNIHHEPNKTPKLYVNLEAYTGEPFYSYSLLLSNNKNDILKFFGFDTTIEYDKLSERNLFVYLTSSTKLKPENISYVSFKGPSAKNNKHSKFNKYLIKKYSPDHKTCSINYEIIEKAIKYFHREKQYQEYIEQKEFLNCIESKKSIIKTYDNNYQKNINRFLLLYGLSNISIMKDETLITLWDNFKKQNVSGLNSFFS